MASLGEQLKAARDSMGKSLDDVSSETNISKRYLEALEENNYNILPGRIYVRGFLRKYDECVGMDPKVALQLYNKITTIDELADKQLSGNTEHRQRTRRVIPKRVIMLVFAVLVIIACLVALFWFRGT